MEGHRGSGLEHHEPSEDFTPGSTSELKTTNADGKLRVPNVVGRSVASATSALKAAGFKVKVGGSVTSNVDAGLVTSQSARSAAAGSTITITRSSGPAPVQTQEPSSDSPGIQLPTEIPALPTELPTVPNSN